MDYNFDEIIPRRHSGSYKWDTPESGDILPMWVADMDFRTAPAIIEALRHRVEHGVFGYTKVSDEYYNAVTDWFRLRHNWTINRDWIIYTSGVVPAVSAIIKAMTEPGDMIITQTPAYNCFFSSIRNNGCQLDSNPLINSYGRFTIDYDNLERLAADPRAKVLILCNPHNPSGRVWTRDELTRIGDICLRNDVFVIADEIHCELTFDGHTYTPFASISPEFLNNSATCISPSKAFNIAGLQIANIVAANPDVRAKIDRAININEVCDVNPFGVEATIAAYRHGEPWLEALKQYIWDNYILLRNELSNHLPYLKTTPLQGTYLAWVDIRATGMDSETIVHGLIQEEKLMLNPGTMYHGEGFIRINLACPRSVLSDAISRIIHYFNNHNATAQK